MNLAGKIVVGILALIGFGYLIGDKPGSYKLAASIENYCHKLEGLVNTNTEVMKVSYPGCLVGADSICNVLANALGQLCEPVTLNGITSCYKENVFSYSAKADVAWIVSNEEKIRNLLRARGFLN